MEGIQGGTATDCVPPTETALLIHGTFSSTAYQTQSSIYTGICGLSDLVLPFSVRRHSYSPATRRRSSEYYSLKAQSLAHCVNTNYIQYGRGKELLQYGKGLLQMMTRRLCHWTPEGLRYHVNCMEMHIILWSRRAICIKQEDITWEYNTNHTTINTIKVFYIAFIFVTGSRQSTAWQPAWQHSKYGL